MNTVLLKKEINGVLVFSFDDVNRFNSVVSQTVKEQLYQFLSQPNSKVVLDLEGVKVIDSSAFGALISVLKTSKDFESQFKLCKPSNEVKELIMIMQLDSVFDVHDTLEECISSF